MSRESLNRPLPETALTRHRRLREQGSRDRADLDAILGAGLFAHLGVVVNGHPVVVPTVYGCEDDTVYFHGSVASRSLVAAPQAMVCLTITHLDGLVLARSVFEHGVNYRSAMIYGVPRAVTDPEEKLAGLRRLSEHIAPGQWDYARRPSRKELDATVLLGLGLTQASVKIRTGAPDDGAGPDGELPIWAGVLPLRATWGELQPDPLLPKSVPVPAHISALAHQRFGQPPAPGRQ